jgi:alkanesulfonate monooxygenase SsuD/methylene tetrahydromethanopterin reductase-like flavin-dependent oxidoreductase (luciferase family)
VHRIGIWLGVSGPRALQLAGRAADGWVPSFRGELTPILNMATGLDEAIAEAGRDPARIRRVLNIAGAITDGATAGPFQGPPTQWVDQLTDLAVLPGFDTFVLWADGPNQLARFAEEIVPATRARVQAERAGPGPTRPA